MDVKRDALRGQFTIWLKLVVKRAKIDYIRKLNRYSNEISIDDSRMKDKLIYEPTSETWIENGFEFENEILLKAFKKLAPKKRIVLELLYVNKKEPEEIAKKMMCSLQYIYNIRSIALKELRINLIKAKSEN